MSNPRLNMAGAGMKILQSWNREDTSLSEKNDQIKMESNGRIKRKLHRLFDEDSQGDSSGNSSDRKTISWRLESIDETKTPSFDLIFNENNLCVIGRKDLTDSKYISTRHCEIFKNSHDEIFLSSQARYDVIYIDNQLASKDNPILLKDGCEIRFCKGHFIYHLKRNVFERNQTLELELGQHSCPEIIKDTKEEEENLTRERMEMVLEDMDACLRARHLRDLEMTTSICRKLLSSFYCDICIEVIASCRSCVPCGHNYCFPCITQYMVVAKNGPPKCPKCRNPIHQTIPNKSIDTAISECLTNIKNASEACLAHVVPSITPAVTESQDISLWSTRYDENEAKLKARNNPPASSSSVPGARPGMIALGARFGLPPRPFGGMAAPVARVALPVAQVGPPPPGHQIIAILESDDENDDEEDEDDDDDEDDDEDEDQDTRFDGSNASAEYARSGRSRCVMCNMSIANRELRISVTESYEYHDSNTRFIHVRCIRAFNAMVSARQRIQLARINLRGVSAADSQTIRNSF